MRSTIYAACGKEVSFEGLGPGKMFGELAAIDGRPRATHVVALASSRVASLRRGEFRELLSRYPRINEEVLLRTTEMVRSLCDRVLEFSTLGVRNRVQAELLRLARDHVHDNRAVVEPLPRHSDIAASVSTHREAVTRELGELERAGVVRRERCRLVVLDVARLERMVRDVLGR